MRDTERSRAVQKEIVKSRKQARKTQALSGIPQHDPMRKNQGMFPENTIMSHAHSFTSITRSSFTKCLSPLSSPAVTLAAMNMVGLFWSFQLHGWAYCIPCIAFVVEKITALRLKRAAGHKDGHPGRVRLHQSVSERRKKAPRHATCGGAFLRQEDRISGLPLRCRLARAARNGGSFQLPPCGNGSVPWRSAAAAPAT